MLENLKQILSSYSFLRPEDIFQLISIVSFKTLKKGEYIIKAGEYNNDIMLVLKGLLRNYIITENGEERTMLFIPEFKNAASSQTVFKNKPSLENIVALENTILAIADLRKFEQLAKTSPSLLLLQNKIMKEQLAFTVDQVFFHVALTAEQRYRQFYKDFPELEQRLSQKDLASYLCITPSSLSRIRARIAKS